VATTVYYCAASLDGYIAESDDSLDWLTGYQGSYGGNGAPPVEGGYDQFYEQVGALVSGAVTYEWVLDHGAPAGGGKWPYAGKPWWVLSSRELRVPEGEGVDVRIARGSVRDLYEEMSAAAGDGVLWVVGGGNVASQFADAGLLDELHVTVVPVVLGEGKPLFDRRLPGPPMQLTDVLPRPSGMVELRYEVRRGA
jgi:dihydrofolate reductase